MITFWEGYLIEIVDDDTKQGFRAEVTSEALITSTDWSHYPTIDEALIAAKNQISRITSNTVQNSLNQS